MIRQVLKELVLPRNIEIIGDYAFEGCGNLASITCHVLNPESVSYGRDVFRGIPDYITVYVPEAAVTAYRNHDVWSRFFKTFKPIPQPKNP